MTTGGLCMRSAEVGVLNRPGFFGGFHQEIPTTMAGTSCR